MIVQHNISSMNANRQLGIVGNNLSKSTEKLSSGYKINRAADDAAGLAISEKMRAQIRGLNRASDNAEDGISLIQTAEGAMDQQHAILQRTRELLVQASNSGTLDATAENDYQKIQDEIDTLKSEYERINTDTEFNRKKLLDGSYKEQYLQLGANSSQGIDVTIKTTAWDSDLYMTKDTTEADDADAGIQDGKQYNTTIFTLGKKVTTKEVDGVTFTKDGADYKNADGDSVKAQLTALDAAEDSDTGKMAAAQAAARKLGKTLAGTENAAALKKIGTDFQTALNKATEKDVTTKTSVDGEAISDLLDKADAMIKSVTTERSKLGAIQNRLEYTVKVDDNTSENLQSAESRIRDTDMAEEMTKYSKESILQQAATSMLAQANQSNQGVLSLLQ